MHGLGNDFVIIDNRAFNYQFDKLQITKISDRKIGVGCDQFILINKSDSCDAMMRIFNKDGSEAEACGNGTRCVAWLIMEEAGTKTSQIQTISGILEAKLHDNEEVSVNMGKPKSDWRDIPMIIAMDTNNLDLVIDDLANPSAINVGNPHVVFFVDNLAEVEIEEIGRSIENHYYFPKKTNVNFAQVLDRSTIKLRTFERGVGLTLACGTGACASAQTAYNRNLIDKDVKVLQDGGDLHVTIHSNGNIEMRGRIEKSFVGVIEI